MVQGRSARTKTATARAPSANLRWPFGLFHSINHPRRNGSSRQTVGFVNAAKAHNSPYPVQETDESESCNAKVACTISASSSAARLWAQVHSSGNSTAYGRNPQSQAEARPTFSLKSLFPIAKIGQQVAAENTQFI